MVYANLGNDTRYSEYRRSGDRDASPEGDENALVANELNYLLAHVSQATGRCLLS